MTLTRRDVALAGGAALSALTPRGAFAQSASPVVHTTYGPVIGVRDGSVLVFKGVRYGADTAPRRFQAPLAPTPWRRAREALDYGAASPQRGDTPNQSEDCLFLNVWTPGADREKRPVMVWVHGGAYSGGSASEALTDGTHLARRSDVVVVSMNHRLNLFGYAYLARLAPGFEDSGNVGQLDLILALQWVRDNISAFGGDRDCVMVFGQSGGGAKIATLMATPAASGLFHRAASMSGQQVTVSGPINATKRTQTWLATLNLPVERVHELRTMPAARLLEAAGVEDPILGYGGLYFGPVMDDRNLHRHPFYPDAAPQSAHIPMMIGNCRNETLAFMGGDPANRNLTWETLPGRMSYSAMRIDIAPETVIAAYRQMRPHWSPDEVLIGATTAGRSWRAAVIEAEERAKQSSPAYVYQLDFKTQRADGRWGAGHGADIPLVFDTTPGAQVNANTAAMVNVMSNAFAAFARTGDPNHSGMPAWSPYTLARRETMVFDVQTRMEDDPRGDERAFFARAPYVQPGT